MYGENCRVDHHQQKDLFYQLFCVEQPQISLKIENIITVLIVILFQCFCPQKHFNKIVLYISNVSDERFG